MMFQKLSVALRQIPRV